MSRLGKSGFSKGMIRIDHPNVSDQLYADYAADQEICALAADVGEEALRMICHL